ncbi:MAG: AAA family ATPase [Clostridia bacterium]|nr:AAA family ATPase [Clostridia bacterium]
MGLIFAIASGKGGTGKSTVSCGLAASFARKGKKVLIVDLDKGLRCIDTYFGIEEKVVYDLSDAFARGRDYKDVFYFAGENNDITVVPSASVDSSIDPNDFADFIEKCSNDYDVIILDLSAGLDFSLLSNIPKIRYICVANQDPISLKDAGVVKERLNDEKLYLIINKFDVDLILKEKYQNIDEMIDQSGIQLIGIIPETYDLKLFPITHKLKKRGRTVKALNRITGRLIGESIRLPRPENI